VVDAVRIPLVDREGHVVGHALVDEADAERVRARGPWRRVGDCAARKEHPHLLRMHRFILGIEHGDKRHVDHRDRDPLNNRRSNLRAGTQTLNNQNKPAYRGSSSRHRGVSWNKARGKWMAQAQVDGRNHFLGHFDDEDEAGRIAREWRLANMPGAVD
jgi:hypothetical protein